MQEIVFIIEEAFVIPTSYLLYLGLSKRGTAAYSSFQKTNLWCLNSPW